MTNLELTAVTGAGAFAAGLLGALTGLGGGMVIVPLLTLVCGVDIRYAIGASLVSVIATSSGTAAAYVREGFTNVRIGMFLEIATTLGALAGAFIAGLVSTGAIAVVFGLVLLHSAYLSLQPTADHPVAHTSDPWAARLRLDSTYPGPDGPRPYAVQRVAAGFGLMIVAGALSGLLGGGQGARHGSGDAAAVQSVHYDQQLHDRRNRGGKRRHIPPPGVYRSRARASRDARRAGRCTGRGPAARARANALSRGSCSAGWSVSLHLRCSIRD